MIFWRTEKRLPQLARTMRLQNLCFDTTKDLSFQGLKLATIQIVKGMIFRVCGPCFLQKIAMIYEDKIVIYDIIESHTVDFFKKHHIYDEIPFYRNMTFDMLGERDILPNRLVVETNDIEVIRELIARGKKISWFSDNLNFCGNFPGLFDFEYLFLNPYTGTTVILPDGIKRKIRARRSKKNFTYPFDRKIHIFFNMKYYRFELLGKLWQKIGFYPKKFLYYVDRTRMVTNRAIARKKGEISYYVADKKNLIYNNMPMQLVTLNILSITYMVWKRSNYATTVKKKTAIGD